MILPYILGLIISYLVGGIPTGYLMAIARGIDIRTQGSGNIGATNVGRVLGRKYGLLIFILDMLKGFVSVSLVPMLVGGMHSPTAPDNLLVALCGLCAVIGHAFPVYLRFKGGKAVATSFGVFVWLAPAAIAVSFGVWVLTVVVSRYVSLGSMIGSLALAGVIVCTVDSPFGDNIYLTALAVAVALLIIIRHVSNIQRIIAGTEKKVFSK